MLLHTDFERHVRLNPTAPAVVEGDAVMSYADLNWCAEKLAKLMEHQGVHPGQLVAIPLPRSAWFIQALLAVLKSGAACLPLDLLEAAERRKYIIKDSQTSCAIINKHTNAEELDAKCLMWDGTEYGSNFLGFDPPEIDPNSVAFIFYTSGSTGRPNGVMISHRGRLNRLRWEIETYQIEPRDAVLFRTPVNFARVVKEVMWPLSSGARIVIAPDGLQNDPDCIIDLLRSYQISIAIFTPSLLSMLVEHRAFRHCTSLRLILSEGEPLRGELADRVLAALPTAALYNPYGLTEVSTVAAGRCTPGRLRERTKIGVPADISIYLLDDNRRPVPRGTVGELYVAGEGIALGYVNNEALTNARFFAAPYTFGNGRMFKTGDFARWLEDGELEYLGRTDSQIKIRGHRIELVEVETAISDHPDVDQVVVFSRDTRLGTKSLIAYISLRKGGSLNQAAIRTFLRQRVPAVMVPGSIIIMPEGLPRLANGKVDRKQLATTLSTSTLERVVDNDYVAAEGLFEVELVDAWERVLGVQPIGVTDNFFDLGGDSLIALHLALEIENVTGREVSLAIIAENPTVRQMAATVAAGASEISVRALVHIQTRGSKPPFFCVHGMFGTVLCFQPLAGHLGNAQPFFALQRSTDTQYELDDVEDLAEAYLQEVRGVQSQGPYYLGGYSFGGLVAFEMASRLIAAGEAVRLLALVECASPAVRRGLPPYDYRIALWPVGESTRARSLESGLMINVAIHDGMREGRLVDWSLERGPTGAGLRFYELGRSAAAATRRYHPLPTPLSVTVFRARAQRSRLDLEPQVGWSAFALGGVSVIDIAGDHTTCLSSPWVSSLAKGLNERLNQTLSL
jgi:amino acid adenylation domain-containing protein